MDEHCVEVASEYAECKVGRAEDILDIYGEKSFDLVMLSHVLEHIDNPISALTQVASVTRRWIVIAVPNPLRPRIQLKYSARSRNYSNKGHAYSWDRSHLSNFLTNKNDLEIVEWAVDRVRVVPFKLLRKSVRKIGLLDRLERSLMSSLFPYYADSLIALCRLKK
jgi:ubiquinone/menaquinone biosynthesis C-methylase UbiE